MKKRIIAIILTFFVLVSMLALPAFADDTNVYMCPYDNTQLTHSNLTFLNFSGDVYYCESCKRFYIKTTAAGLTAFSVGDSSILNNALSATTQAPGDNTIIPIVNSSGKLTVCIPYSYLRAQGNSDSYYSPEAPASCVTDDTTFTYTYSHSAGLTTLRAASPSGGSGHSFSCYYIMSAPVTGYYTLLTKPSVSLVDLDSSTSKTLSYNSCNISTRTYFNSGEVINCVHGFGYIVAHNWRLTMTGFLYFAVEPESDAPTSVTNNFTFNGGDVNVSNYASVYVYNNNYYCKDSDGNTTIYYLDVSGKHVKITIGVDKSITIDMPDADPEPTATPTATPESTSTPEPSASVSPQPSATANPDELPEDDSLVAWIQKAIVNVRAALGFFTDFGSLIKDLFSWLPDPLQIVVIGAISALFVFAFIKLLL